MKRYLVTGGCGFIGSHLVDALVAAGHAVRVVDDLSTGTRAHLPTSAELIVGDIADPATIAAGLRDVDGCFHLAAIASVERGVKDWLGTHRANLTGTIALLDAIRAQGASRGVPVVYASSAAVYGNAASPPVAESTACQPLSAYGADKYGCELHARVAAHVHAIPNTGLRFFNVYGPRQDPKSPYSGAISIFCDRIGRGAPVTIFGDGAQTRDFVYVADVVGAIRAAMDRLHLATAIPHDVFNVCTGHPVSIAEVARAIARLSGQPPRLEFQPARAGEIRHSHGDPTQARGALGFTARVALEEGLRQVLAWAGATTPA